MTSYPPTIAELRAAFIEAHPGCVFVPNREGLLTPQEDNDHSTRRGQEWINFLNGQRMALALEAGIESQPVAFPMWYGHRLDHAEANYAAVTSNPAITPDARLYREREWQYRLLENQRLLGLYQNKALPYGVSPKNIPTIVERAVTALRQRYRSMTPPLKSMEEFFRLLEGAKSWAVQRQTEDNMARQRVAPEILAIRRDAPRKEMIDRLSKGEGLPYKESEAVLGYLLPEAGFNENTLLALRVANRYALNAGVAVKDVFDHMRGYTLPQ